MGVCITTITGATYTAYNADKSRQNETFQDRTQLFRFEHDLLPVYRSSPNKGTCDFEFKFPESTRPGSPRWQQGSLYQDPSHPLPPSFHTKSPEGSCIIAYFLQATLERSGSRGPLVKYEYLPYQPTSEEIPGESSLYSRVLRAHTRSPSSENKKTVDKVFARLSSLSSNAARIVPTFYYPTKISPGQDIPLFLSVELNGLHDSSQCILDSVTVTISTYTTISCGPPDSKLERSTVKHVTCLSKANMATPMPFGKKVPLTNSFRLVDNAECIPSFDLRNVTRRYELLVTIGLKHGGHNLFMASTTAVEILPRQMRGSMTSGTGYEEIEEELLPAYSPIDPAVFHRSLTT